MKKHLPAVLTGIGLLILWQVIAMCINAAYILPSPTQIAVKIWELREPLFTVHTPATMLVTLIGLLISVVLGVGLAVVMERFECVERALYPVIVTTQTIPVTAIAPLFVLWLGYGIWSKVLVAVLITFFPITISVHDGLKSAKRENEELRNEKNRLTLQKDDVTDLAEKYEKQIEGLKEECVLGRLVMDRLQSLEAKNHMLDQARDSISSLGSRKVCEICEFEVDICYSGYGWG